ncbi:PH domain-containing protein [Yersinia rohdei]|uniref:PH domain-containing protein n=1 Tax=Yersinia rohdei TaxID=29485 RepID=UPI00119D95AD|nr:PH domain-containing protein [Yersinia rohdei]
MKENKHVIKFKSSHLKSGESVVAWSDGYIGNVMGSGKNTQRNGVLLVTDLRVTFYRKGIIGEIIQNIPLKSITSIERKSTLGHRVIRLHTSHDDLEFKTFSKEGELQLIDAIELGRGLTTSNNTEAVKSEENKEDEFSKLKKLAQLKEAGIISEEEYQVKRTDLLNRI